MRIDYFKRSLSHPSTYLYFDSIEVSLKEFLYLASFKKNNTIVSHTRIISTLTKTEINVLLQQFRISQSIEKTLNE